MCYTAPYGDYHRSGLEGRLVTRPKAGEIRKFDPSIINLKGGAYVLSGLCSHGRFCHDSPAVFMVAQQGRSGIVWIGLCFEHALKRVGGNAKKLP